jgi:hypothetical protein
VKALTSVGLAVFFSALSFAQHHYSGSLQSVGPQPVVRPQSVARPQLAVTPGFGSAVFPGGSNAFGRVVFPGAGQFPVGTITDPTFASRLGATVGGFRVGGFNGGRRGRHFRESSLVPYAYPVYLGGYADNGYEGYGNGYGGYGQDQPNITIMNPPQQAPQVIINQNFIPERANPVIHEYTEDSSGIHVYEAPSHTPAEGAPDEATDYYLIAFKDHSIYSAFAYWVEGDTLHYVTPQRVHNQASVTLVDRELTQKLNSERNLQVKLPR